MYSDLEKIKAKKEKKIKEYYNSYLGGAGLDTLAIQTLKDKKYTKKRKLNTNSNKTHKQLKSVKLLESNSDTVVTDKETLAPGH